MIKDINEIKKLPKSIARNFFKGCVVTEKIDGHSISVEITAKGDVVIRKSNGKAITEKDMILSGMWDAAFVDWRTICMDKEFVEKCKGNIIYMMYIPCAKPLNIDYSRWLESSDIENSDAKIDHGYVVTNIKAIDDTYKESCMQVHELIDLLKLTSIKIAEFYKMPLQKDALKNIKRPVFYTRTYDVDSVFSSIMNESSRAFVIDGIKYSNFSNDDADINSLLNNPISAYDIAACCNNKNILMNDIFVEAGVAGYDYEGLIIKNGRHVYQKSFETAKNDNEITRVESSNRTGFEYVLREFIIFLEDSSNDEKVIDSFNTSSYVKMVNSLFSLFSKNDNAIERIKRNVNIEDLNPPGKLQVFNMKAVKDIGVRLLLDKDKLLQSIYKILLANLDKEKNYNYCVLLSQEQVEFWNYIVKLAKPLSK